MCQLILHKHSSFHFQASHKTYGDKNGTSFFD